MDSSERRARGRGLARHTNAGRFLSKLDYRLEPGWRRRLAPSSMLLAPNEAIGSGMLEATVIPADLIDKSQAKA
ncbi:MAG: hypothetical protein Pars2KO_27370 [Parasphingorhabdus sp.]